MADAVRMFTVNLQESKKRRSPHQTSFITLSSSHTPPTLLGRQCYNSILTLTSMHPLRPGGFVWASPACFCPPPTPPFSSTSIHQSCHAQQMSGLCAKCQEAPKGTNWRRVTIVMAFWKSRLPIEQDVLCSFRSRFSIYPALIMKKRRICCEVSAPCVFTM